MKARPVIVVEGRGLVPCEVHEATHLTIKMPGPTGVLTLPVMIGGTRAGTHNWTWNGDMEKPTLRPSIKTTYTDGHGREQVCHSWLNDGIVQFLNDCTHSLRGQTVPLLDLSENG